jgi:hypothetical protein
MKTKTIIIVFVICLVFISLLVWGYAKNGNTAASVQGVASSEVKSSLIATSKLYDFGTISMKNGDVSKDFTFTNPTNKNVIILGLETSCMCTSALLVEPDGSTKGPFGMPGMGGMTSTNETIKTGENRTLRVIYNPNAHGPAGVGQIDRFITLTDSTGETLQFEIKAVVTP